jgi:hypothetical protein
VLPHPVDPGSRQDGVVHGPDGSGRGPAPAGLRLVGWTTAALPVAAAVAGYGELSAGAMVTVLAAGFVLAGLGLQRRAGSAAPPARAGVRGWLVWLGALAGWELCALLAGDRLQTLSDLLDPTLAHRVDRGLATLLWFAAGVWLLGRPSAKRGDR